MENIDKLESVKRTRLGVVILGVSVLLMIISYLLPPVSLIACLTQLFGLIATIGSVVGLVLIARGSSAFSREHVWLTRAALIFVLISVFLLFVFFVTSIIINAVRVAGMDLDKGAPGSDLRDLFRMQIYLTWIGFIPSFIMMGSYLLGLWGITPKWGKVVLGMFILATLGSMIGGGFLIQDQLEGEINEIDPEKEYDVEDYTEMGTEIAMKAYTAGMMRLAYLVLLLVASVSSLLYVNGKFKDAYISG